MPDAQQLYARYPLLPVFARRAREAGSRLWLVGGVVRDALLGRDTQDIDLIVEGDARTLATAVADEAKAACIELHDDPPTFRVVKSGVEYDVSEPRGSTIDEDLADRDLTINALAMPLDEHAIGEVRDAVGGLEDLRAGVLRMIRPGNYTTDPLRVLRVFRFAAQLGYTIDPLTREACWDAAPGLAEVATERVWEETKKIFASDDADAVWADAMNWGVFEPVFVELAPQADEAIHALAMWCAFRRSAKEWLVNDPITDNRAVMCAAALFSKHPTVVEAFADRMRVSARTRKALVAAIGALSDAAEVLAVSDWDSVESRRRLARWTGRHHEAFIAAAALAAALERGPSAADAFGSLVEAKRRYVDPVDARPPLTGGDLIRELNLEPGPVIGELLAAIREEAIAGGIGSREDALAFAAEFLRR